MRKWTYLVAALLMSGATATFTSCIDTEEPAGITELRGAKARLLDAKAKVQEAEVLIKTARANLIQAKADYKQQLVKQKELENALKAEINAYKQDSIQREMKVNEQKMNKKLTEAQFKAEAAQAEYEKAMIEIEIALMGYKENAIAAELMKVISVNPYQVNYSYIDPVSGNLTTTTRTMYGLNGINFTLRGAEKDLAQYMRELFKIQSSYDISSKIAAAEGQLAIENGNLIGLQEDLANLETIAGKPYEEWDAQYKEFEADSIAIENQKTELGIAKEEALKPVKEQEKAQNDAATAKSEIAFTIPEAIQGDFADVLSSARVADFDRWKVEDADGNATYPNGVKASMTMDGKKTALGNIIDELETTWVLDAEALAGAQAELAQKKAVNDAFWTETTGTYYVDLEAWKTALKNYQDLYNTGKYFDANLNDRAVVIKAYNNLSTLTGDALTAATTAFRTQLKAYLAERVKIDGFKIEKTATPGTVIDPTDDTDWAQWQGLVSNLDDAFGKDIATDDIALGGAYKVYKEASAKLGYDATSVNPSENRQTEYTYAEYEDDNSTLPSYGTVKAAFEARKAYEDLDSKITNKADWDKLYADLNALNDANQKALDELNLAKAETAAERSKIETEYVAKETALNVEMAGLVDIMGKIQTVIKDASGSTETLYAKILQNLKNEIAKLKSGTISVSGYEYIFATNGSSIPDQQVVVASYEKLIAELKKAAAGEDSLYIPAEEALIAQKQTQIENQNTYIAALEAVFKAVSDKKDALLAALAAE